ncbi:hypothetical protein [Clostridium thermarum]|uniref:hypothetical protein n=1 Tax=Clostridium thermarum TaxID=1716543 RepID=UPI0015D6626F|nr:hypothetical protein [Clostridium thermarum]
MDNGKDEMGDTPKSDLIARFIPKSRMNKPEKYKANRTICFILSSSYCEFSFNGLSVKIITFLFYMILTIISMKYVTKVDFLS